MNELVKVNNQELEVIEWNNERVITTAQLADVYGTDIKVVSNNFNRNKDRFDKEKHYYLLSGDELKNFKTVHQNDEWLKHSSQLYLWTKRGASRHCKMLGTEKAWEQFDYLEEAYFNPNILDGISEELRAAIAVDKRVTKIERKIDVVNDDLQDFKQNLPLLPAEAELITYTVNVRAVKALGGKESNAYKDKSLRGKVYSDIHRELKRQFGVTKYKYIKSCNCDLAVSIIESYELPIVLQEQIRECNAQINIDTEVA